MSIRRIVSKLMGLALVFGSGHALSQTGPNPNEVHIQRLTYSGPGCAQGTVAHNMSRDAKAFTLLFGNFIAEAGPGVPSGKNKSSCRLTVDLRFPEGWTYALFTVDYRGFMSLDRNVSAVQKSTYYFQANPGGARTFASTFYGPTDRDYHFRDAIVVEDLNYAPCGRNRALNIDTEVAVNNSLNRNGSGLLTIDSINGQLAQTYGILWRRC